MHIPRPRTIVNQSYPFLKKKKEEGKKKKREALTALLNRKTRARSKKETMDFHLRATRPGSFKESLELFVPSAAKSQQLASLVLHEKKATKAE